MKKFRLLFLVFIFPIYQSSAQHFIPGNFYYPAFEKGKYGYINSTGQWVINPKFDWCDYFFEGKAIAKEKDKFGVINIKGDWLVKPSYDTIKHYAEGFAAVAVRNEDGVRNWDFIDTAGNHLNLKVPALSDLTSFSSGIAIGSEDGFMQFYFFNYKGDTAFSAKGFYMDEKNIADFSENLLHVYIGEYRSTYIDTTGKNWGNGNYEYCGNFNNGMAWILDNMKYGYINLKGETVIAPQYDSAGNFSEGIALVKQKMIFDANEMRLKGGFVGYIDKEGKTITPAIYATGTSFSDGLAMVNFNNLYGFINSEGKVVIDFQFSEGQNFYRGLAFVKKDNQWMYINTKGNKVF